MLLRYDSAVTPLFYPTQIGVPPTLIWSITDFGTEEDWRIIGAVAMVIQCKNCTEMRDFCKIGTIFTPIETIFSFRFIKIHYCPLKIFSISNNYKL